MTKFSERVMEALSQKTIERLRAIEQRRKAESPTRVTDRDIQPFAPAGVGALTGTAGTSGVPGMHGHW